MSILLRLLINAAALWVATQVVDGIAFTGDIPTLLGVALVFGVLNVVTLKASCPRSSAPSS
jgi:putative membrane protein